jgi:uncharacterized damage-inducible protein DinB
MRARLLVVASFTLVFATSSVAHAQTAPPSANQNPMTAGAKAQFTVVKDFAVRAAQKVPEDLYSFKPTPEVRSFGELVGHITDAFYGMCSTASGTKPPRGGDIEKTVKGKADLVKAITEGAAYCDSVYAAMNDKKGTESVDFYFGPTPRVSVLYFVVAHTYEHYGNMVTYMRLKGIVPPSSEAAAPGPPPR